jgi:hypothetical protein
METLQKAGAFALILGAKCLRQALSTLADIQESAERDRPSGTDELRALRDEMEAMNASLRAIKATLNAEAINHDDLILQ